MMRQIKITKYQNNTHYSIHVVDSFGQEHHIGYSSVLTEKFNEEVQKKAEKIWSNEVKQEVDLMSKAINNCISIDIKNGRVPSLD